MRDEESGHRDEENGHTEKTKHLENFFIGLCPSISGEARLHLKTLNIPRGSAAAWDGKLLHRNGGEAANSISGHPEKQSFSAHRAAKPPKPDRCLGRFVRSTQWIVFYVFVTLD